MKLPVPPPPLPELLTRLEKTGFFHSFLRVFPDGFAESRYLP